MTSATDLERHFFELVNAARADIGLMALDLELNLNVAADAHSQWMTDADTFSHTGVGGSNPSQRMASAGYDFHQAWRATENIAAVSVSGTDSYLDEVNQLFVNLMNSPGHRANILDADVTSVGIGLAFGPLTYPSGAVYQSVLITNNFARTLGVQDFDRYGDGTANSLTGDIGDDHVNGEGGNDTLRGLDGHDLINGGDGADLLAGNSGNDTMFGGAGADRLFGGDDDDDLNGDAGADTVNGGSGDDMLRGGAGHDRLDGESGADTLAGNTGNDTLFGGDGADTLFGGDDADVLYGDAGQDSLNGGAGDDMMRGGADADHLSGTSGNDTLAGNDGDDTLLGGDDDDRLIGGQGADILSGGSGADVFVWSDILQSPHGTTTRDSITDFEAGIDRIDLSGLASGLSFVSSYTGAGNEVRYNDSIGRLYVDLDGNLASEFSVDLGPGAGLTESDLIL